MRLAAALLTPLIATGLYGASRPVPVDLRALVRQSLATVDQEEEVKQALLWTTRGERTELDADGKPITTVTWVARREVRDGVGVSRVSERNGKRLDSQDRQEEEHRIEEYVAEMKRLSAQDRARQAQAERQEEAWLHELPDAMDFRYVGEEIDQGRPVWLIEAMPRPGYRASSFRGRLFEKLQARIWIDQEDRQLVRVDAEVFDAVNVGFGLLGRIDKGTRFFMQRSRIAGAWVTTAQRYRFGARMLFRSLRNEVKLAFSEFQRVGR